MKALTVIPLRAGTAELSEVAGDVKVSVEVTPG